MSDDHQQWAAEFCLQIRNGDVQRVKDMLDKWPQLLHSSFAGDLPLCLAAYTGESEIAELLIERGADINLRDGDDNTPLFNAVMGKNWDMVDLLVAHGAEVDIHTSTVLARRRAPAAEPESQPSQSTDRASGCIGSIICVFSLAVCTTGLVYFVSACW